MAKITKTTTLPDSANKTDFYSIVEDATVSDIVNADIKSDAAIADTKLAQITTAGKVSGAALTSLNNIPLGAGDIPKANLDGDWDTDGTLSANSDDKLPTQKAVKTYADTKISKSTAGEINALTEKTTLSDNDIILIEDSAASYAKKKVKKQNLVPAGITEDCQVADGSTYTHDGTWGTAVTKCFYKKSTDTYLHISYDDMGTNLGGAYYPVSTRVQLDGSTIMGEFTAVQDSWTTRDSATISLSGISTGIHTLTFQTNSAEDRGSIRNIYVATR